MEPVKYCLADFIRQRGTPLLVENHLAKKNDGIWGLHPLPFAENNVGGNHLADLVATSPRPPFLEKIRQIVFYVLKVCDSSKCFP